MSEKIHIKLKNSENIDFKARVNFAISTDPDVIPNAIERLIGLSVFEVKALAVDTIYSGIRKVLTLSDKNSLQDSGEQ